MAHQNLAARALAKTPVLLVHGGNDIILPVFSTKLLCEAALASGASVDVCVVGVVGVVCGDAVAGDSRCCSCSCCYCKFGARCVLRHVLHIPAQSDVLVGVSRSLGIC